MESKLQKVSNDGGPSKLPYQLIKSITDNFSEDRRIGRGGLGTVYKGTYENGEVIAVKVLHIISGSDVEEFQKEFQNLWKLKHKNVVKLVGFCNESENVVAYYNGKQVIAEKMHTALCVEYVPSGSLTKHISDASSGLDWRARYKIIKGICEGVKYLREGLDIPVWHLDLKTENILLDKNMIPKISDFGLSRLLGEENTTSTVNSAGTKEYLPPEYIESGIISEKFDIYSLGVIITKIMAGNEGYYRIVEMTSKRFINHVYDNWRVSLAETVSPWTVEAYCNQVKKCLEIALQCMKSNRQERPNIQVIVSDLIDTETVISDQWLQTEQDIYSRLSDEPRKLPLELLKNITNTFSDERKLGSGTFGDVYKGVYKDGQVIAVKMLRFMPGIDEKQFKTEFDHLKRLKHKNIVKLVGFCNEEEEVLVSHKGKTVRAVEIHRALCLEFVPNGGLGKFISEQHTGLDWPSRFKIIMGICKGLKYLHEVRVTHLDLKPDNILLDEEMVPKIADFGLSRLVGEENTKMTLSPLGTLGYLPPEFITKQVISLKYDIFSLGVIIKKTVAGIFDYSNIVDMDDLECIEHVHQNWCKRLHAIPMYPSLEGDCKQVRACIEIAINCMETDPRKRPTMIDIVYQLNNVETRENYSLEEIKVVDMPGEANKVETLERILIDKSAEPASISYSLMRSITSNFSEEIGRGRFGIVYLGVLRNSNVAVKKLSTLQGFSEKLFVDQIRCLLRAKHTNIVRFLGYCHETQWEVLKHDGTYVLAEIRQKLLCFEYVPNGTLQYYLTEKAHVDEWKIRYNIIKGICQGLHYLHTERLNHLDLKPENVLLDDHMEPKLTDFSLSKFIDEGQSRIVTEFVGGAPLYIAPEIREYGELSFKSDVFSLGIIIIKLLRGQDTQDMKDWDKFLDVDSPQMKICIDIARACVDADPHKRPTVGKIIRRINATESIIQEVSPVVEENDPVYSIYPLSVHPLELSFPFKPKKSISCLLQLHNNGGNRVAFMLLASRPRRYTTMFPICGVVPPWCTRTLAVTTRKQQQPPLDSDEYFTLHSFTVSDYDLQNINQGSVGAEYDYVFKKAKEMGRDEVQEVTLRVTSDTPLVEMSTSEQPCQLGIMLMIEKFISLCGVKFLKKANEMSKDVCDLPAEETAYKPSQSTLEIMAAPSSQQVLSIDVHPREPWMLTVHQVGCLRVWNYHSMAILNSFEVTDEPVQAAKFIASKKWVIAGDCIGCINVYSYDEHEMVISFDAHDSPITSLAVHPTHSFVLSSSYDDHLIKLWDWEKDWECTRTFQGHTNRVTQITFNPDVPDSFASASMDGTVKIWSVHSEDCGIVILNGHVVGHLCVDYFTSRGHQYLITGTMDGTAQIRDLEIEPMDGCVENLEKHAECITAANLHPELPFLITGSLDGTIRLWNSTTYKLENIICFNLGAVYAFGFMKGLTRMAVGCHQGIAMIDVSLP